MGCCDRSEHVERRALESNIFMRTFAQVEVSVRSKGLLMPQTTNLPRYACPHKHIYSQHGHSRSFLVHTCGRTYLVDRWDNMGEPVWMFGD